MLTTVIPSTVNLYGRKNVAANNYGMPISKYYPDVSSTNVILDNELVLNTDIGPYEKGTKLTNEKVTDIITALVLSAEANSHVIDELKDTVSKQERLIEYLKEIIEEGGGGGSGMGIWPDIGNIDGGSADEEGENGGKDDVHLIPPV